MMNNAAKNFDVLFIEKNFWLEMNELDSKELGSDQLEFWLSQLELIDSTKFQEIFFIFNQNSN